MSPASIRAALGGEPSQNPNRRSIVRHFVDALNNNDQDQSERVSRRRRRNRAARRRARKRARRPPPNAVEVSDMVSRRQHYYHYHDRRHRRHHHHDSLSSSFASSSSSFITQKAAKYIYIDIRIAVVKFELGGTFFRRQGRRLRGQSQGHCSEYGRSCLSYSRIVSCFIID